MRTFLLFMLLLTIAFSSCSLFDKSSTSNSRTTILWVNSYKKDCEGVGPMTCLLIQENEVIDEQGWTYLYQDIEGFTFEPGYRYQLEVRITKLDPATVPADASNLKYELLEVLEKSSDQRSNIHDIWALETIKEVPIQLSDENNRPILEVHVSENKVMGKGTCNQYGGDIVLLTESDFKLDDIHSTLIGCPDQAIESAFLEQLAQTATYRIAELKLYLYAANGDEILRFRKID